MVLSVMVLPSTVQPSFTSNFLASFTSFIAPRVVLVVFISSSSVLLGVIRAALERVLFLVIGDILLGGVVFVVCFY